LATIVYITSSNSVYFQNITQATGMNPAILFVALFGAAMANDIIDGEYMARLRDNVEEEPLRRLLKSAFDADVQRFYHIGDLTLMYVKADAHMIERVRALPEIEYVEPNQRYYTQQNCASNSCPEVWGLDRVDQIASLPYSSPIEPTARYEYGDSTGEGSNAYIIDTGILITHTDFGGRATWGYSAGELGNEDGNGHGTHCAGTVGGNTCGLAKAVRLVAVKVMTDGGSGLTTTIVEGMEWVGNQTTVQNSANLSLGGGASSALDNAVAALHREGVVTVVAAGNSNADACNSSPGRAPLAITVGATAVGDNSAGFTNWGTCVDIFAPGVDITSTWIGSDTTFNVISGTSMACPHVVGAVARYQSFNPSATADEVATFLVSSATPDLIQFTLPNHDTSPNLLLYAPCTF
jgi:subtilisin family serine protease